MQTEDQRPTDALAAVRAMQLVDSVHGWALTDRGLSYTTDGGRSWRNRTPPGVSAGAIKDAYFFDSSRGWVVADDPYAERANGVIVHRTIDGGVSWLSRAFTSSTQTQGTSAVLSFITPLEGWLVVQATSSSAFQWGELYATADGGLTWTKLAGAIPFADDVAFLSTSRGWGAGGPTGQELFSTFDGGRNWEPVSLPVPPGDESVPPNLGPLAFFNERDGVLPVTLQNRVGDVLGVGFYVTRNEGRSWEVAATAPVDDAGMSGDVTIPTALLGADEWIVVTPNGGRLIATSDGGKSFQSQETSGLPAGVFAVDFANRDLGWAFQQEWGCEGFKTDCWHLSRLFATTDGGQTWSQLTP